MKKGQTLGELLAGGVRFLREESDTSTPRLDAEVILAHVLGVDRVYLYRESDHKPSPAVCRQYRALLERRAAGEPVAYITGHKEFMGLDFIVGPPVLIPRPETELMVETALQEVSGLKNRPVIVDVGTGSGAVAVSLARLAPHCDVYATDISAGALALARENAARHGVGVRFYRGDLLEPLRGVLERKPVRVITANLPYIPDGEMDNLPREVRDYEPREALAGGCDGLEHYRRLVSGAARFLAPEGLLLMEISPEQAGPAALLVPGPRWETGVLPDLAGRPRLVAARLKAG